MTELADQLEALEAKLRWLCHYDEVWPLVEAALRANAATPPAPDREAVALNALMTIHKAAKQAYDWPVRRLDATIEGITKVADAAIAALGASQ